MYVTTDAVETFVEEHYQSQIVRLKDDIAALGECLDEDNEDVGDRAKNLGGLEELLRMLELCCEDEVHFVLCNRKDESCDQYFPGVLAFFCVFIRAR